MVLWPSHFQKQGYMYSTILKQSSKATIMYMAHCNAIDYSKIQESSSQNITMCILLQASRASKTYVAY